MNVRRLLAISTALAICLMFASTSTSLASTTNTQVSSHNKLSTQGKTNPQFVSPQQPWVGYSGEVKCTADPYLNTRTGPGLNYPIKFGIDYGQTGDAITTVSSSDGSGNWCEFQAYDGSYEYGSATYLEVPPYTF
ncbi:Hypothetical protein DEACI_3024 [Acididesulfobacillus acetoxydans]|uniref:SH3 domain-containing protein n=1 Tax=Acididesulfobacillus acetoxydans TaxID=1561005 RepID=A0A8S0X697_9FIRM|nr:Hypothetical protein DEACI_3024 [Acididesulfobacillus acetoxydans]CEJ08415.1 Hypothetical protein DEACI_2891 [Acididesulfobacillus acetoxydans]